MTKEASDLLMPMSHPQRFSRQLSLAALVKFGYAVKSSYWFVPLILTVLAIILAYLSVWLDAEMGIPASFLPSALTDTAPSGARAVMSVVAGAVIGTTGVMFSLTLVAVSFASSQYGPRLIGNFMGDHGTQWSLGILIATFVYSVIVLKAIEGSDGVDTGIFIPHFSVFLALVLMLISVGAMIYFIHHVPETINVSKLVAGIGHRLETAIREEMESPPPTMAREGRPADPLKVSICLNQTGYLQSLDLTRLSHIARQIDCDAWLLVSPGAFVTRIDHVMELRGIEDISSDLEARIQACFALGDAPTVEQNPTFFARQLSEVATRALSPGVNDPYTAIECVHRIQAALELAISYGPGVHDSDVGPMGLRRLSFKTLLDNSYELIMPYAVSDTLVRSEIARGLRRLSEMTEDSAHQSHIKRLSDRAANPNS